MNTSGKKRILVLEKLIIPEVVELDQEHLNFPWSKDQWFKNNDLSLKLFTYRQDELVLGFALFSLVPGDETAHLLKICLKNECRGTGASVSFWNELVIYLLSSNVKSVFLEVESSNSQAKAFYEKVGFCELRFIRNYYSNGQSAYTMLLTL